MNKTTQMLEGFLIELGAFITISNFMLIFNKMMLLLRVL
jgi:hypothetical protein